jgi:S-adenosylmethionine:tRNA ribosyltransferase-isomerase
MDWMPALPLNEFMYDLPQEKIAQYPAQQRDASKLLIYRNNKITDELFKNITSYLPADGLMIFNETKVIQARLFFSKETGADIEIFCLEPVLPAAEIQIAFAQKSGVIWKCFVGNSKKWKSGQLRRAFSLKNKTGHLLAERIERNSQFSLIRFDWAPEDVTFSEILEAAGIVPLPPYVLRPETESDKVRYQTIYAQTHGSVAAPTAGLHFTDHVLNEIKTKGIKTDKVTLHVGAGTFKPITGHNISRHVMHTEKITIKRQTIQNLLKNLANPIILVGTTTVRTLESLYWFGVKSIVDKDRSDLINTGQWDPYNPRYNRNLPVKESLEKVMEIIEMQQMDSISGQTQLMIVPGYSFKLTDFLITNFHMPGSTLLLLVSAFTGNNWKMVYDHALKNNYRFLSYGDSCLFSKSGSHYE